MFLLDLVGAQVETQPYDHSIAVVPDSPNPIAVGNPEKRHYFAGPIFSKTMQEAQETALFSTVTISYIVHMASSVSLHHPHASQSKVSDDAPNMKNLQARARASKEDPAAPRASDALPSHSGSPPEPTEELPDVDPQKQRDLRRAAKDAAEEKKSGKKDKEIAKTKKQAVKETKKKKDQEEERPQAKKKKEKKQPELTNGKDEDEEEEEEEREDEEEEEEEREKMKRRRSSKKIRDWRRKKSSLPRMVKGLQRRRRRMRTSKTRTRRKKSDHQK